MEHNPSLGEYILLPQKTAPWGQNLYFSIWGRSWNYSGKAGRKKKERKNFQAQRPTFTKVLRLGKKKKRNESRSAEKSKKVGLQWVKGVSGWWWGWRARVLWPWEGFWTWVWWWKGFKQGNDMMRQSHCKDHLGVSVDKMRVFDRRQTPAWSVHVSVRHDTALGDHGDIGPGKWTQSRDT